MRLCTKQLIKSVSFLLILILLLAAGSRLFLPKDNRSESGMEELAANGILGERDSSIDVLFIGDSEAVSSFSPMEMWNQHGFTSYVCATSGQPMNLSYYYLVRAFQKQTPKVVVLETDTLFQGITMDKSLLSDASLLLPIFQYHNRWKSLKPEDITSSISHTWTDPLKGYNHSSDVDPADASGYMAPSDQVQEIESLSVAYLKRIQALCQSRGVSLLLVSTPSTKNWNYPRHNGVAKTANELGLSYIDLNTMADTLSIDWATDTRDKGDHLNDSGAKKVSAYMGDYLKHTYQLPDHRQDSAYASWNLDWEQYRLTVG